MGTKSDNRDWVIDVIVENLIPLLEKSEWNERYQLEEEDLKESRRILAEEYWEAGNAFLSTSYGIFFILIICDHFSFVNPTIYGLALNIAGAAMIFFGGVRDPMMISASVDSPSLDARRRLEARKMAYHNAGFGLLGLGFLFQVIVIGMFPAVEIIGFNIFAEGAPPFERGAILGIMGLIFWRYTIP